jgi:hypothetical protein
MLALVSCLTGGVQVAVHIAPGVALATVRAGFSCAADLPGGSTTVTALLIGTFRTVARQAGSFFRTLIGCIQ